MFVKPYIKWVGNKFKLLSDIIHLFPQECNNYYEPFCGSGAVFLNLAADHRIDRFLAQKYFLSDSNEYLINCHNMVSRDPQRIKQELKYFEDNDSDLFYKEQRLLVTRKITTEGGFRPSARFIYFNRRAYGGMWRVNSSGVFNVPRCAGQNAPLWNNNIEICSKLLKKAHISHNDYSDIRPVKGDFVFLDPPYYPVSKTSNFTGYTKQVWTKESHDKLMVFLCNLNSSGVMFLMTNNDCPYIREHVAKSGFKFNTMKVHRFIDALTYSNGKKKYKRDQVDEIMVCNYGKEQSE